MRQLWQKEATSIDDPLYIDLFENTCNNKKFKKWIGQLNNNFWQHNFHNHIVSPNKSNETSNMFRMEGNSIFRNENLPYPERYNASMEFYNRSLMFSEIGTDHVSLAYANRSACFFNLNMFDKCLIDIEYAKKANYPEKLMAKLDNRKAECIKLQHVLSIGTTKMIRNPKLDFAANKHFPCMANVMEIKRNNEFGRFIAANCDIDVGKMVLVEETFFAVDMGFVAACFTCLKRTKCFIPCSLCTDVVYCSKDCMNRNKIHKISCGALYRRLPPDVKIPTQSLLVAIDTIPNAEDLMDFVQQSLKLGTHNIPTKVCDSRNKYALFLKLASDSSNVDSFRAYKVYTSLLAIPSIKASFDSERKQRFLMHLVVHHISVQERNCFAEFSETDAQFNVASIACVLSLVNHSCAPNLINFAVDNREVCVTIRPVKKGEQLFISYISQDGTMLPPQARQDHLKKYYDFDCKCEKCVSCAPGKRDCFQMMMDPLFQIILHAAEREPVNKAESEQRQQMCIAFLNKYGHLPWSEEFQIVVNEFQKLIIDSY